MTTILNDTEHKDTHLKALFLNGIILLGEDIEEAVLSHLLERKVARLSANDLTPCPQGYHRDANGICVADVG